MNISSTQFVFEGKLRRNLIIGMVIGVLSLALTFMFDDAFHTRFWTNYLQNTTYFAGLSMMVFFFMCAVITAFGGWFTTFRRVWEAMSMFMLPGAILLLVLVAGVWGHLNHLYHWNVAGVGEPGNANYDEIIAGKLGFLNPVWYTVGTVGFMALWYFWAQKVRSLSLSQDDHETASFTIYKTIRKWAASFLPIGGFLVGVYFWQLLMAIDTHWYSTMFAWYSMISTLLGGISLTVMLIIYLKSKGYLEYVTRDHLHDIGKFLFGISVFWTYLWFDQYMLIWYSNNGEETIYFKERVDHYPVLFWGNLLLNFVAPFLILMRNSTKRKFGTMFFVAAIVFFGHWWDFFYMIKPGARIAADHAIEHAEGKHHDATSQHETTAPVPAAESHADHTAAEKPAETAPAHADEHATATESHAKADSHAEAAHPAEAHPTAEAMAHPAETAHPAAEATHEDHHDAHAKPFMLGFTIPGFEEIGAMIGFLSLFLFVFFTQLAKAPLLPKKDPFLEESLHHETGVLIDSEQEEKEGHDHH